jgi:NADP-dependent 3-hydroxy acid dehydrogenase YdfG
MRFRARGRTWRLRRAAVSDWKPCATPAQGRAKILLLPFDVTDYDCHPTMVGAAIEHFGQVDILVNNAGVSQRSLVLETDFSVDRRIMEVNYFSVVSLTKTVLPYMIERGGGHIAVVSSLLGKFSTRCARRTAPLNTRCTATSMRCDRGLRQKHLHYAHLPGICAHGGLAARAARRRAGTRAHGRHD